MSKDMEEAYEKAACEFLQGHYHSDGMKDKYASLDLEHSFDRAILGAVKAGAEWQANQEVWCFDMDKAPMNNQEIYGWNGTDVIRTIWAKTAHVPIYGWIDYASFDGDGFDLLSDNERPIAWMRCSFPQPPKDN